MAFGRPDIEGVLGQIASVGFGAGQAHGETVKRLIMIGYERFELFGGMVRMHGLSEIVLVENPGEIFSYLARGDNGTKEGEKKPQVPKPKSKGRLKTQWDGKIISEGTFFRMEYHMKESREPVYARERANKTKNCMNTKIQSHFEHRVLNESSRASVSELNRTTQPAAPASSVRGFGRRSFMKHAAAMGAASLLPVHAAFADRGGNASHLGNITDSDAAILRFLAAAEILETDLWQQYSDFVDQDSPYTDAIEAIDDDMPTYIDQNTADEFSHENFLNAFLVKMHKQPVNLEQFRTLPSSPVAQSQVRRVTNLMHLNVDTSWYVRYRSSGNPDFGDAFGQAVNIVNRPAIPTQNQGLYTSNQIQAIANTAAFHFAMIEQGGSSLYDSLSLKCSSLLALRIVTSIGGTEVAHFEIWNDKAGDAPPVDSGDGLVFPDLNQNPVTTTSLVMPQPCKFISEDLPLCSVIRPTSSPLAGAVAVVQFLTETGLFHGQSDGFFHSLLSLAVAADRAVRRCDGD
jgi:hypothetical protein